MSVAAKSDRLCDLCGGPGPLRWSGFFETRDGLTRVVKKFICRRCEGPGEDPQAVYDFQSTGKAA